MANSDKVLENKKIAVREGLVSLVGNVFLFIAKIWIGIVTGSIALIVDAWHTLSDSFSSLIIIFGAFYSSKPADKEHPYGHGRIESVITIIIGVLLGVIAFTFFTDSISILSDKKSVQFGLWAIIITSASVIVKEAMAQYAFWCARVTGNKSLKADGWHHRSDAISSVMILVGIFFGKYFWWIDGVLGLLISALMFYTAFELIREAVNPLLGQAPDEKFIDDINSVCSKVTDFNLGVHNLHLHDYGIHKEVVFHIYLPGDLTLNQSHSLVDNLEKALDNDLGIRVTIHTDPVSVRGL